MLEVSELPLYEYECPNDGTFERMQKFSDPPLTRCPTCGGPVEKLLSAPAIQFKGTGWYVTDYARKSEGGKDKGASSEKKEPATSKDATRGASSSSSSTSGPSSGGTSSGTEKK
ncbi:MAG TPA: FmdB family zinc ribbon protein [Vicinamibacteria bacterium]|nr:FmdB family zinc ribbon protein [Vicinamibacteria bacterium]